jgi:hypothetical protein
MLRSTELIPVLLMLSRSAAGPRTEPRIEAMVWTSDKNPNMVAADSFRTEAELRLWLGMMSLRGLSFVVHWTAELKADKALTEVLAEVVEVEPPPPSKAPTDTE